MNDMVLKLLEKDFKLRHLNIGNDVHLSAKGMDFVINSYDIEGYGHLCTIAMKAMLGLMKMETAVICAENKDMPLFNMDRIDAMGKHTQIVEMYDNQIHYITEEFFDAFMEIKDKDHNVENYTSGSHWYDDILYPFSYAKTKKGNCEVFDIACENYLKEYLKQAETARTCNVEDKKEKTRQFAQGLLDNGGPAVNQFRKLFGEETTRRIVLKHMYGIDV